MIKNLAPHIVRKRLLIEGFYGIILDEQKVKKYLLQLAAALELRTYGDPIVFAPSSGMGKDENAGFDAFVPLIDSGISAYFWSKEKFASVVLYTCKDFNHDKAKSFTKEFLQIEQEIVDFKF